ncbi:probable pectinesterase/pectinesterase inhibitor 36 [Nicotiana tomentosiformis]|uniref:probable pectinesterase/pectinesterase inhibitor 36 n=1 Tax=Nicotiana tomentosiformis TaxID=4098 RepID=UPI00051BF974|nr:probable pectinesterase/pectinesterase inhibitor 36 [Nicotiana tomentosiformis]
MSRWSFSIFLLPLLILAVAANNVVTSNQDIDNAVQRTRSAVLNVMKWARGLKRLDKADRDGSTINFAGIECVKLYEDTEPRLAQLVSGEKYYSHDDAVTWLSAALASHRSCLDGLEEKGLVFKSEEARNLTLLLKDALFNYGQLRNNGRTKARKGAQPRPISNEGRGLLASWNAATSKADIVIAQDGSGNYKTINEAVAALSRITRPERTIVYVKSGVYRENVEIGRELKNLMFVGDGIDKTIVTGNKNVQDGATTLGSATFGVSADEFWARDMTFENTAGPHKHQAVALRVGSDLSIFYRCSFRGYQDTLLVHSLRQFYRDCHIYGTIDFIFGDAAAVFQNCDIFVKRPMDHQSNMITAQGRDDSNENTGIVILNSRVAPSSEFSAVKGSFMNYLGRPWKKYSRTVFIKTDLDGLIHPKGWKEWSGNFALSTLYYGEYMNTGSGADIGNRVNWPGFHVLRDANEASPFTVRNFIQGESWIPASGVPYLL